MNCLQTHLWNPLANFKKCDLYLKRHYLKNYSLIQFLLLLLGLQMTSGMVLHILILKWKFFDYFAALLCSNEFSAALPVGRGDE